MQEQQELLYWDIYEVNSDSSPLTGVKFRGRMRKHAKLILKINFFTDNAVDSVGNVRFALLHKSSSDAIEKYIHTIFPDAKIKKVLEKIANPVLSKLNVNDITRYPDF